MTRSFLAAGLLMFTVCLALAVPGQVAARGPNTQADTVPIRTVLMDDVTVYFDNSLSEAVESSSISALKLGLPAVPRISGLPPFHTPIEVFIRDGNDRFRDALVEKAGVPIALVAQEIGGYAIERDGVMLLFFVADGMDQPEIASFAFAHELAHLAVREASQRRPVPQWLNEGYAQWTSYQILREQSPHVAGAFEAIDRAVVSSAIHSGTGILPWAQLVTRSRFSRAGTEGWVDLAYGQSTLFVDWLERTYGRAALASFLLDLGSGTTATPAFSRAFGPFAPNEQAFRASIEDLAKRTPRGVHWLTEPSASMPLLGLIGGSPRETMHVEIWRDGAMFQERDEQLNQAGFGYIPISTQLTSGAIDLEIRAVTPSMGTIVIRSNQEFVPAQRVPAPVQLPVGIQAWLNRTFIRQRAA